MIEVEAEDDYTPAEKKAIVGAVSEPYKRKKKDSDNINSYMNITTKTLQNQGFTPEIKD